MTPTRRFLAIGTLWLAQSGLVAQGKPNFSGSWGLDPSRSESVTLPATDGRRMADVGDRLVIRQTEAELRIERLRSNGDTEPTLYRLDGSQERLENNDRKLVVAGVRRGPNLERIPTGEARAASEIDLRSLGSAGELIVERVLMFRQFFGEFQEPGAGIPK